MNETCDFATTVEQGCPLDCGMCPEHRRDRAWQLGSSSNAPVNTHRRSLTPTPLCSFGNALTSPPLSLTKGKLGCIIHVDSITTVGFLPCF